MTTWEELNNDAEIRRAYQETYKRLSHACSYEHFRDVIYPSVYLGEVVF